MPYAVELTDTFGGEANYCWVRRAKISDPPWPPFQNCSSDKVRRDLASYQRTVMRRAKASVGMTGARGVTTSYGDGYEFRPYRACMVLFVQWDDSDTAN